MPPAEPATGALGAAIERALETGTDTFDHAAWDVLLRDGTEGGLVDYEIMRSRREELDASLGHLLDE